MDFAADMVFDVPPAVVWKVLTDFRRAAACVPGCEDIEELEPLLRYRAVMRQRVGPFKLEAPVEITVESVEPESVIRARASGKDRLTGTSMAARLGVALAAAEPAGTRLGLTFDIQVGGRLASLGWPMIKKRTQDVVDEFGVRLRATLVEA